MSMLEEELRNFSLKGWLGILGSGNRNTAPNNFGWWEEYSTNDLVVRPLSIWGDIDSVPPALDITTAQSNAAANPSLIEDYSLAANAIRLTPQTSVPTNRCWYATSIYDDMTTRMKNWIMPQLIPRTDVGNEGQPSIGYAVRLWNGDPAVAGTEILLTAEIAGSVPAILMNYGAGAVVMANSFAGVTDVTELYMTGFRYIGSAGGGGGGQVDFSINQAAHGFTAVPPTPIYFDSGTWKAAKADSADTLGTHLVIEVSGVDNFKATNIGRITIASHTLTIGEYYFVSADTAGALVSVEPEGFSNPIVFIEDADTLHILPYRPSTVGTSLDPGWSAVLSFTYVNQATFYVPNTPDNLAIFKAGRPLRYRQSPFTWNFGIINSISVGTPTPTDISVYMAGAMLSITHDEMLFGEFNKVSTISFAINGEFADTTDLQLLLNDLKYRYKWSTGEAYLVLISHRLIIDDSAGVSANPRVNIYINGLAVCSTLSYAGRGSSSFVWIDTVSDIDIGRYKIEKDDTIEIGATLSGTGNNDASNLSIQGTFVFR